MGGSEDRRTQGRGGRTGGPKGREGGREDPTEGGRERDRTGGPKGREGGREDSGTQQREGGLGDPTDGGREGERRREGLEAPKGQGERERRFEDPTERERGASSCLGSNSETKRGASSFCDGLELHVAPGSHDSELSDCSSDSQFRGGLLRGQVESESSQSAAHSSQQERVSVPIVSRLQLFSRSEDSEDFERLLSLPLRADLLKGASGLFKGAHNLSLARSSHPCKVQRSNRASGRVLVLLPATGSESDVSRQRKSNKSREGGSQDPTEGERGGPKGIRAPKIKAKAAS